MSSKQRIYALFFFPLLLVLENVDSQTFVKAGNAYLSICGSCKEHSRSDPHSAKHYLN